MRIREMKWESRLTEEPGGIFLSNWDGSALSFLKSYLKT